jgi:uncharacterized protein (TIGR02117 family)
MSRVGTERAAFRIARLIPLAGAAAAALLVLAACVAPSTRATAPRPLPASSPPQTVYVVKRGWHIDVGIARTDAQPALQPLAEAFPQSQVVLFGFGDRRYLLQGGGVANTIAAFLGGAGLMLVTSVGPQQPEQEFGGDNVVRLALTAQQMSDLQGFIARSFALRDGAMIRITPGPHAVGSYSAYYESAQHYSALHTCNSWAAQVLESAQLPISSTGVEFAGQLWQRVRRLEGAGTDSIPYARGAAH